MGKYVGVSTALLLIAILGALCNPSVPTVWAQNPLVPGSLFINCGSNASYVDNVTKIPWVPDGQYITTGVNAIVPVANRYWPDFSEFRTLRYFPDSSHPKDCYSLPVTPNNTYQIRATFFWGDYDGADHTSLPKFGLAIDGTIVDSNFINDFAQYQYKEYFVLSQTNVTSLCLCRDSSSNTDPFISAISLVPVDLGPDSLVYDRGYFHTQFRWNFGGNGLVRYPDDPYDRYWDAQKNDSFSILTTSPPIQTLTGPAGLALPEYPPRAVLDTALTTNGTMTISLPFIYSYDWIMLLYCIELDPTANATSREFYFAMQGYHTVLINPYLSNGPVESVGEVPFSMTLYQNSTTATPFGPLVNALEVFEVIEEPMALLTNDQDALAIEGIKANYSQLAEWTGDPCLPYPHPWITCNTINVTLYSPFITAVNLSGYNLTGPISPSFGMLTNLTSLVLDSNKLNGSLPDVFSKCPNLNTLNFDYNNFSGTMNMLAWDQDYLSNGIFISMVNNSISGLEPSWDDKSLTYSPILLGGNPICNNLKSFSSNPQISYHQQLNCRYNNTPVSKLIVQPNSHVMDKTLIWILSTTLSFSLIFGGIICVVIFWKYQKNALVLREIQKEFDKQVQPTLYSYNVLKSATRDFHHDNELGKGGFGVVYKGSLVDGTKLAVKLLTTKSLQNIDDFLNEVVAITGVTHKNLVKLKGCCLHRTQRLLVYEFLENKDLAEALWGCGIGGTFLDWPTRFKICVGVARGLAYLHENLQPCIIHRDIKASNILLDNNLNAKITDFGLARLFSEDQSHLFTKIRVGTFGYMSPEYAQDGELSTKVDVYSFGVLLLEIISGRKSIMKYSTSPTNRDNLVKWASNLQRANTLNDLVDQNINNNIMADEVQRVIKVAFLCLQFKPTNRPLMSHVIAMLENKVDIPNNPSSTREGDISFDTFTSTNEENCLLTHQTMLSSDNIELTNSLGPR